MSGAWCGDCICVVVVMMEDSEFQSTKFVYCDLHKVT